MSMGRRSVAGGGPIGVEMAQAHRRLGIKVTLLEAVKILPRDDPELVGVLENKLQEEGVVIRQEIQVSQVSKSKNGLEVEQITFKLVDSEGSWKS